VVLGVLCFLQVQGDHLLLLALYQLWAAAGFGKDFVRAHGLDLRGMNFAKEVRKQLAGDTKETQRWKGGPWGWVGWREQCKQWHGCWWWECPPPSCSGAEDGCHSWQSWCSGWPNHMYACGAWLGPSMECQD
jgi:hypothetical protein